jgi:hypothetical protein
MFCVPQRFLLHKIKQFYEKKRKIKLFNTCSVFDCFFPSTIKCKKLTPAAKLLRGSNRIARSVFWGQNGEYSTEKPL